MRKLSRIIIDVTFFKSVTHLYILFQQNNFDQVTEQMHILIYD